MTLWTRGGRRASVVLGSAMAMAVVLAMAGPASADPRAGSVDLSYGGANTGTATVPGSLSVVYDRAGSARSLSFDLQVNRLTPAGTPDLSFGAAGVTPLYTGGYQIGDRHVDLLANGSMVVGTVDGSTFPPPSILVTRSLANGAPDLAYGTGGLVVYPVSGFAYNEMRDVVSLDDGTTFVAGWEDRSGQGTARRINPDGSLTTPTIGRCRGVPAVHTLTANGMTAHTTSAGSNGRQAAVLGIGVLGPNTYGNSIVLLDACGRTVQSTILPRPSDTFFDHIVPTPEGWMLSSFDAVMALDRDLRPIRSFGVNGVVMMASVDLAAAGPSAVDSDGRVVLAGGRLETLPGSLLRDRLLVRLTDNGRLDPSFGSGGIVVAGDPIDNGMWGAVAVDRASRIYVSWHRPTDPYPYPTFITRYNG